VSHPLTSPSAVFCACAEPNGRPCIVRLPELVIQRVRRPPHATWHEPRTFAASDCTHVLCVAWCTRVLPLFSPTCSSLTRMQSRRVWIRQSMAIKGGMKCEPFRRRGSGQLIPRYVSFLLLSVVSTQWVWGGWTGCSASCDQGTQTNTAICSGGICNPADQPATLAQNWYVQTSNRMTNCDDSGSAEN
jgi:hypothetical protein